MSLEKEMNSFLHAYKKSTNTHSHSSKAMMPGEYETQKTFEPFM